jgi:hypothetical protein
MRRVILAKIQPGDFDHWFLRSAILRPSTAQRKEHYILASVHEETDGAAGEMSGTTGYRVDPGTGFGAGVALVKTGGLLSGYEKPLTRSWGCWGKIIEAEPSGLRLCVYRTLHKPRRPPPKRWSLWRKRGEKKMKKLCVQTDSI